MRRLIATTCLFTALAGCSSSAFEGAVGKSDKDDKEEQAEDDAADDDVIDDPQLVAGAFLTCEKLTPEELEVSETEIAIACDVFDDAGPVNKESLSLAWSVKDDGGNTVDAEVPNPSVPHDVTFVFAKATVNKLTIHLRMSKGGVTQDISLSLEHIEAGEVSSKPYVVGFEVLPTGTFGLSYVDDVGKATFDWRLGEFRVTTTSIAGVNFTYNVRLSDGSVLEGQVLFQGTTYTGEAGAKLLGDWSHVKGVDLSGPTLVVRGRNTGATVDPLGTGSFTASEVDGLPEYTFSDTGIAGGLAVSGSIPLVAE